MKKSIRTLGLLAVSALTLCSCLSKTDYASFHSAATAVESVSYTKATFKGSVKVDVLGAKSSVDVDATYTYADSKWSTTSDVSVAAGLVIVGLIANRPAAVTESSDYTYYCGGGFKVEYSETSVTEWNEYGYVTSVKDGDSKLTASWSK